jgi:AcrR family transcriptional regulator
MVWQRARSADQKEQRRQGLLAAAARLHATQPIENVSLNAIAREANISKANVYRYFESREELFLRLTLDSLEHWVETLVRRLGSLAVPASEADVSRVFAATIVEHQRFARLSAVLSTVLERNVSTETVVQFKTEYLVSLSPLQEALGTALGGLDPEDTRQILEAAYFLMVGMWPAAHPAPPVSAALERPELQTMCVDFEARFAELLSAVIRGVRAAG